MQFNGGIMARIASATAALASLSGIAAAQATRPAAPVRQAVVVSPLVRSVAEAAAVDSFRQRTHALAYPAHLDRYSQGADISWHLRPHALAYQVLRSWNATGPWVAATPDASRKDATTRHIEGLLPGKALYFRVVALDSSDGRLKTIDSSNVAAVATAQSVAGTGRQGAGFVHFARCTVTPRSTVAIAWHPVPDASGYRILYAVEPAAGAPGVSREPTKSIVLPANVEALPGVTTVIVRDTAYSQNAVPSGRYDYAVEPLYRMINDSQEVWSASFGVVAGGLVVPSTLDVACGSN